jgi:hypothetical protein
MKGALLTAVLRLVGMAAIIISLQPCIVLFFREKFYGGPRSAYEDSYWAYLVIRSWLIVLAGIGVGVVFFWISSRIKSRGIPLQSAKGLWRCSIRRIAAILGLVAGAWLTFSFMPGLSDYFNLDRYESKNAIAIPQFGTVFMVMSNELAAPRVEFLPSGNGTNLWPNASIALPQK